MKGLHQPHIYDLQLYLNRISCDLCTFPTATDVTARAMSSLSKDAPQN